MIVRRPARGFTLIEILAVVFILAVGMSAVIALAAMGRRWAGEAQARFTGAATAFTMLYDATPQQAPGDAWTISGAFAWTGGYTLSHTGVLNGYWVRREETSAVTDIIDARRRWAWVTVDVFWGVEGHYITTVHERILRAEGTP